MAEQLAKVGDVIQQGEAIPGNVTEVNDRGGDAWKLGRKGWYCARYWDGPPETASGNTTSERIAANWGPLTVTAVREQPAEYPRCDECGSEDPPDGCHIGCPKLTHPAAESEPDDVVHYRIPGDASATTLCGEDVWDESTSVTERAGSSNCEACRVAAGEDPPKSQTVRVTMALGIDDRDGKAVISTHHLGEIGSCDRQVFLDAVAETFGVVLAPDDDEVERLRRLLKAQAENFSAATDKLIAERDDARANLTRALQARGEFLGETIRLRTEIERLKSSSDRHEPHVDGPHEPTWQEVGDHFLMEALGVQKFDEVMPAIERLKAEVQRLETKVMVVQADRDDYAARLKATDASWAKVAAERDEARENAARLNEIIDDLKAAAPQQDGPIVLTLPEVPEGADALVDRHERRWRLSETTDLAADGGGRVPLWESESGALRVYPALLAGSGPLTVEMAPPREPRTWPKLDDQSDDNLPNAVKVHGAVWRRCSPDGVLFSDGTSAMTLAELRTLGDVTEVLDEPGGQQ